jgi:hypothetical protein
MDMKKYKPERIVTLLRQIELGIANGKPPSQMPEGFDHDANCCDYVISHCLFIMSRKAGRG